MLLKFQPVFLSQLGMIVAMVLIGLLLTSVLSMTLRDVLLFVFPGMLWILAIFNSLMLSTYSAMNTQASCSQKPSSQANTEKRDRISRLAGFLILAKWLILLSGGLAFWYFLPSRQSVYYLLAGVLVGFVIFMISVYCAKELDLPLRSDQK